MTTTEEITIPDIENLAWSEPKAITTQRGVCMVKSAEPTEGFWNLWRANKEDLKAVGFSIGKFGGSWQVSWWEREGSWMMPVLKEPVAVVDPIVLPECKPLKFPQGILGFQLPLVPVIVRAIEEYGSALNACGTGLGKTFMTLAAARELNLAIVVVCPKPITGDWEDAAKAMGVKLLCAHGWEWMKTGKTPFLTWTKKRVKKKLKAGGYALVDQKDEMVWNIPPGVAVVFDEVHRAANDGTQNSKMVQLAGDLPFPKFTLSATIADNPVKMRAIGYLLKMHRNGKDWFDWMKSHGVVQTRFGPEFQGTALHLKAVHRQIFPHKGIRVRAEQLGDAFPKTQIVAKAYNMEESKEIRSVYKEMMNRCAELEAQEMDASGRAMAILVEILRARQRVELLKVPLTVELATTGIEEGMSVFMAVNFRDTLKELIKWLGVESVIMGGQRPDDRKKMIARFQANETNKLAGIIKACREGLNLHDIHGGHPRLALIMPTPSAFDLRQVFGRVWRAGGLSPSIQRVLFARGTIEEDVCHSLATKLDHLDLLMDGDLQKGVFPNSYSAMRPQTDNDSEELVN